MLSALILDLIVCIVFFFISNKSVNKLVNKYCSTKETKEVQEIADLFGMRLVQVCLVG